MGQSKHPPGSVGAEIEAVREEREALVRQIRKSEETIERSRALLKRLDAVLAKIEPQS
jgi:hypothetical protein